MNTQMYPRAVSFPLLLLLEELMFLNSPNFLNDRYWFFLSLCNAKMTSSEFEGGVVVAPANAPAAAPVKVCSVAGIHTTKHSNNEEKK